MIETRESFKMLKMFSILTVATWMYNCVKIIQLRLVQLAVCHTLIFKRCHIKVKIHDTNWKKTFIIQLTKNYFLLSKINISRALRNQLGKDKQPSTKMSKSHEQEFYVRRSPHGQ